MNERVVPLTVEVADLLPLIKRFLYAEREIFLRELISNAIDALTKLKTEKLKQPSMLDDGEPLRVEVMVDPVDKVIAIADNGIGMSSDEVVRFINQIAFSGAKEFLDRHADPQASLIGQFGLGFYSSFMVSKLVEIETRSWRLADTACRWGCDGGTVTRIEEISLDRRGTRVICHLQEDAHEFLNLQRIEKVIQRYLDYAPYPIFVAGRQVNTVTAPWHLSSNERAELPSQCYWDLYERLNPTENHPMGWFSVDNDYPFQVHGLLFVPNRASGGRGNLRLFASRTFICDHCTELLPRWLDFLEGVVDSNDLPLNVARDRFQDDRRVTKLREYLTTKALEYLTEMLLKRRRDYMKFWEQYGLNLKYFYYEAVTQERWPVASKLIKLLLFPSSHKPLTTLDEYMERLPDTKQPTIIYLTDLQSQRTHLEIFLNHNHEVLYFTDRYDPYMIDCISKQRLDLTFARIDQVDAIEETPPPASGTEPPERAAVIDWNPLLKLFREIAGNSVSKVTIKELRHRDIPAILNLTKAGVWQDDTGRMNELEAAHDRKWILQINTNCALIQTLGRLGVSISAAKLPVALVARIWDNVQLNNGLLQGDNLTDAVRRNNEFLALVANQLVNVGE